MIYHSNNMQIDLVEFKTQINPDVLNKEIVVSTQDEYAYWGDVMKLCKNKIKEVEEERKEYTKPIDEAKKRLMDKEKEIVNPIKQYIEKIEKVMAAFFLEEQKKRQEEQKRLENEAIKNAKPEDTDVVVPVVESLKTTRGSVSTTTGITYNEFEVINADEIPREYLMPDESKIKNAINAGKVKEIKGIKIIQSVRFSNR
jgi:hypothetical protein